MARALPAPTSGEGKVIYRTTSLVFNYKNLSEKIASFQNDVLLHKRKEILEEKFFNVYSITPAKTDIFGSETVTAVSSALKYWAENTSSYICDKCKSVVPVKMPYNFIRRPQISQRNKCRCTKASYQVPRLADIPKQLLNLSAECIRALRPFEIDCGIYERKSHEYRVKTGVTQLRPLEKPVLQKISDLPDKIDRKNCHIAYEYLINSLASSFPHFVNLHNEVLESGKPFNCYDFSLTVAIECALWPNLYPPESGVKVQFQAKKRD